MRTIRLIVAITLFSASASAAPAESPVSSATTAEAKKYFEAGLQFYKDNRYSEALAAFVEANRLSPRESIQRNIAQTHRDMHDYASAYVAYDELLAHYGTTMKAIDRANAEKARLELAALTGIASVSFSDPEAEVSVDGKSHGHPPAAIRLNLGMHSVVVTRAGYDTLEQTIEITGRESAVINGPLVQSVKTGHIEVTVDHAATVFIDGNEVGAAPWQGDLEPGVHKVEAKSSFGSVATTIDVTRGGKYPLTLALIAAEAPPPPPPVPEPPPPLPPAPPQNRNGLYTRFALAALFPTSHHDTVEDHSVYGTSVPTESDGLYGAGLDLRLGYALGQIGIEGIMAGEYDYSAVKAHAVGHTDDWAFDRGGGTLAIGARWLPAFDSLGPIHPTAGAAIGVSGRAIGASRTVEDSTTHDRPRFDFYVTPTFLFDAGITLGNVPGGRLFVGLLALLDLPASQTLRSSSEKDGKLPIPANAQVRVATGPELMIGPTVGLVLGH